MPEVYQDKSEEKIKADISEQFKKDDWMVRDDYEIYASAKKLIDAYVKEIKKSDEAYWPWALQEFKKLDQELSKEMTSMQWFALMFKNKEIINDLANRIDDAEKVVVERLTLNRTNKVTIDEQKKSAQYFTLSPDNSLVFTSWVNVPKIHEVLGRVFKNKNESYKIDYTWCTNERIKKEVINVVGTSTCYINYDSKQKTYLLKQ